MFFSLYRPTLLNLLVYEMFDRIYNLRQTLVTLHVSDKIFRSAVTNDFFDKMNAVKKVLWDQKCISLSYIFETEKYTKSNTIFSKSNQLGC